MSRSTENIFFCSFEVLAKNLHNTLQMTGVHGLNKKQISKHIIISRHKISPEAAKPVEVKSLKNKIFKVFLVSFKCILSMWYVFFSESSSPSAKEGSVLVWDFLYLMQMKKSIPAFVEVTLNENREYNF